MSNSSNQNFTYLLNAIHKFFIFVERPQVQTQLLAIAGVILFCIILHHFLWYWLKQKFPYLLILWGIDQPI